MTILIQIAPHDRGPAQAGPLPHVLELLHISFSWSFFAAYSSYLTAMRTAWEREKQLGTLAFLRSRFAASCLRVGKNQRAPSMITHRGWKALPQQHCLKKIFSFAALPQHSKLRAFAREKTHPQPRGESTIAAAGPFHTQPTVLCLYSLCAFACEKIDTSPKDQHRGWKPLRLMTNFEIIVIVVPAKAGIQCFQALLDPDFRRGDGLGAFSTVCAAASRSHRSPARWNPDDLRSSSRLRSRVSRDSRGKRHICNHEEKAL